jgi:hypothetical protein
MCKTITQAEDGIGPVGKVSHGLCLACSKIANLEIDLKEGAEQMKKMRKELEIKRKENEDDLVKCRQLNIRLTDKLRTMAIEKAKLEYRTFTNYVTSLIMSDIKKGERK